MGLLQAYLISLTAQSLSEAPMDKRLLWQLHHNFYSTVFERSRPPTYYEAIANALALLAAADKLQDWFCRLLLRDVKYYNKPCITTILIMKSNDSIALLSDNPVLQLLGSPSVFSWCIVTDVLVVLYDSGNAHIMLRPVCENCCKRWCVQLLFKKYVHPFWWGCDERQHLGQYWVHFEPMGCALNARLPS